MEEYSKKKLVGLKQRLQDLLKKDLSKKITTLHLLQYQNPL